MRLLPILLAPVLVAALAPADGAAQQQRHLPGSVLLMHVRDPQGRPISDAQVVIGGLRKTGRSDAAGEVFVTEIPSGNRLIDVRRPGFAMVRVASDFSGADTVRREITMAVQAVELEGIVATSWGRSMRLREMGFYDRQRRGLGAYMTSDRIELLRPYQTFELFRYMRGFSVRYTRDGPVVVTTRGKGLQLGECIPIVYLDGMALVSGNTKDQHDALYMILPEDIEGVEAYAGPASIPAEYNPLGSACGVILVWTRH